MTPPEDWMARQDEWRTNADLERSLLSKKIDGIASRVDALTIGSARTEEWLKTNHDTLTAVADTLRSLGKLGDMAEKVAKVVKPIFWLIALGGAVWAWGGKILATVVAHLGWVPK